VLLLKTQRLFS
jgi:hypothetical protein